MLEICIDKHKIRFFFDKKWRMEDFAGKSNLQDMWYHSSNGQVIHKKLNVIEVEYNWLEKKRNKI